MGLSRVTAPTIKQIGSAARQGFLFDRTARDFFHMKNPTWRAHMLSNSELGVYSGGLRPSLRPHEINLEIIVEEHGSLMNYLLKTGLAQNPSQKIIGVFFAGGPAPSGNAVIKQLVLNAHNSGAIVVGFKDGCDGLLSGEAVVLTRDLVKGTHRDGDVIIGTARTNPSEKERADIKDHLAQWGIEGLVAIGGDDTQTTANRLHQLGIPMVGVPKTIDNDVPLTDLTFGHETVVHASAKELHDILSDARTRNAWYMVQIMGRKSGSWAMRAAKAGASSSFFIPEMFSKQGILDLLEIGTSNHSVNKLLKDIVSIIRIDGQAVSSVETLGSKLQTVLAEDQITIDFESFLALIKTLIVNRKKVGNPYGVIAIGEGLMYKLPTEIIEKDASGKPVRGRLVGMGAEFVFRYDTHFNPKLSKMRFADIVANRLTDEGAATTEAVYFGYQFRCASDVLGVDINLSTDFGNRAADALLKGEFGNMVAVHDGKIVLVPFDNLPLDETGHIIPRVVDLKDHFFLSALEIAYNKSETDGD